MGLPNLPIYLICWQDMEYLHLDNLHRQIKLDLLRESTCFSAMHIFHAHLLADHINIVRLQRRPNTTHRPVFRFCEIVLLEWHHSSTTKEKDLLEKKNIFIEYICSRYLNSLKNQIFLYFIKERKSFKSIISLMSALIFF